MKRRTAVALGALGLSWIASAARAGETSSPYMVTGNNSPAALMIVDTSRAAVEAPSPLADGAPTLGSHWENTCSGHGGAHLTAGAGVYIIQPHFENNPAFIAIQSTTTPTPSRTVITAAQSDLPTDTTVAPQAWIGVTSDCGLGFRTRWWHFDESYHQATVNLAQTDPNTVVTINSAAPLGLTVLSVSNSALNDPLGFSSNLKISVLDFEATQEVQLGKCALLLSGGVRYGHISQDYRAIRARSGRVPIPGDGANIFTIDADALESGHNFNGAGPVIGLEVRRPIASTGLSLYGSSRGSLLFGDGKQRAFQLTVQQGQTDTGAPIDSAAFNSASSLRHDLLSIAEAEIGLELSRNLSSARVFAQTALIGQVWFGADNASRSSTPDTLGVLMGGTIQESNLGFVGLSVRAGVDF